MLLAFRGLRQVAVEGGLGYPGVPSGCAVWVWTRIGHGVLSGNLVQYIGVLGV